MNDIKISAKCSSFRQLSERRLEVKEICIKGSQGQVVKVPDSGRSVRKDKHKYLNRNVSVLLSDNTLMISAYYNRYNIVTCIQCAANR